MLDHDDAPFTHSVGRKKEKKRKNGLSASLQRDAPLRFLFEYQRRRKWKRDSRSPTIRPDLLQLRNLRRSFASRLRHITEGG